VNSATLATRLGHEFADPSLFERALTHRSAAGRHNERLEFLGDSVLNFLIAEQLFQRYPDTAEGDLSRLRALLVKGETLADLAEELELGQYLLLGSGERKSGGHRRRSILADTVEAILGAIYLDAGFEAVRKVVASVYAGRLENLPPLDELKDPKTRLQEYLQGNAMSIPEYRLLETTGAAHEQQFVVECAVSADVPSTQGLGRGRRRAEQAAATAMLAQLNQSQKAK